MPNVGREQLAMILYLLAALVEQRIA